MGCSPGHERKKRGTSGFDGTIGNQREIAGSWPSNLACCTLCKTVSWKSIGRCAWQRNSPILRFDAIRRYRPSG